MITDDMQKPSNHLLGLALQPLFKYLPAKYLDALVGRGELLFRSLSYFRNYEELEVRGDRHEGRRLFHPDQGLQITKNDTGERVILPGAFEASVKDREIYIFCLSLERSPELASDFGADVCVEFPNPAALFAKVRTALMLRKWVRKGRLLHGPVGYYSPLVSPFAEWAVPERMVMRKTIDYEYQCEYRLAFARGNALDVNNVAAQITATPGAVEPILDGHPQHILKVGSLAKICTVHADA